MCPSYRVEAHRGGRTPIWGSADGGQLMASTRINFDTLTDDGLLIEDFATFQMPRQLERAVLLGLLEEFRGKKSHIVVNSTQERHQALLKDLGFEITEEYDYAMLVTGVYEFDADPQGENDMTVFDFDAATEEADV